MRPDDLPRLVARARARGWTVGYQGRTVPELLRILGDARIERLLDVRERPQSRKPGFSKTSLARSLEVVEIDYEHRPELGTPAPIRHRYQRTRDVATFRREFEALLTERSDALDAVAARLRSQRTALFCFERDPNECHRIVLCRLLEARGVGFTHLGAGAPDETNAARRPVPRGGPSAGRRPRPPR